MIPVNEPLLDGNEKRYLAECIESGWISSEGPFVRRFEQEFADRCERKYGTAVANGTAALQLAVEALGIGAGDEVILPSFTIISCAAAIVRAGAIPVPVDCDAMTWNITADYIEAKITPRTRAIMVVHMYGLPADMDSIMKLANRHGIDVIEDAAHVHGHRYKNQACGSFGRVSTFSFYPNKIVTSGEGGMVLTDDETVNDQVRSRMNLCFRPEQRFNHEELGWNYRLSNLQAAVGLAQLEQLDRFLQIKKRIGNLYQQGLKDIPGIQLPPLKTEYADNVYWVFGLVVEEGASAEPDTVVKALAEAGIGTRPFFWPIHEQPVFTRQGMFSDINCPNAERIARRGFYLPSGLALTEEQQAVVIDTLNMVLA
ncbi:MAG: DegT/DnrJ/EryC1/StrS family aminotransferase [Gammaproteobacteria bacterium]